MYVRVTGRVGGRGGGAAGGRAAGGGERIEKHICYSGEFEFRTEFINLHIRQ
jgi:hypothetical protein